jgi:hypothetical protein
MGGKVGKGRQVMTFCETATWAHRSSQAHLVSLHSSYSNRTPREGVRSPSGAVWGAAQKDSIISSLPREQQTKMCRTTLSPGSDEGVREIRRFVYNVYRDGARGSESLPSDFHIIAPHRTAS